MQTNPKTSASDLEVWPLLLAGVAACGVVLGNDLCQIEGRQVQEAFPEYSFHQLRASANVEMSVESELRPLEDRRARISWESLTLCLKIGVATSHSALPCVGCGTATPAQGFRAHEDQPIRTQRLRESQQHAAALRD